MIRATAFAAVLLATPVSALAAVDLSGYWMLKSDPMAVPPASVTPAAARTVRTLSARVQGLDAVRSPEYAQLWCTHYGMPWQTTFALPMDIRQGALEVLIVNPIRSDRRHIYTDGQGHPDPDSFDPTTVGHSIGRWQGDTLVVDTTGFSDKGVLLMPGGGLRSPRSRLTERYRLAGPDTLRVTYSWSDPATLRRPHSYTYEYVRMPGPVWMPEVQCNPLRAIRAKGLPLPSDAPQN